MNRVSRMTGAVVALCVSVGTVRANVATFDSFQEGGLGQEFSDDGIRFFDPDAYGLNGVFVIEWAEETLGGPFFSKPNALTMTGFVPGPQAAFSRVGSFRMTTGNTETSASVEVFVFENSRNTITLQATRDGRPVAQDAVRMAGGFNVVHHTLAVSGVAFDELRLFGSGDFQSGAFFGMVDNVRIGEGSGACTGREKLKARCKNSTVKVKLKKGEPEGTLTFRLDDDPNTDTRAALNRKGKTKVKYRDVAPGRHRVAVLECEIDVQTSCP